MKKKQTLKPSEVKFTDGHQINEENTIIDQILEMKPGMQTSTHVDI